MSKPSKKEENVLSISSIFDDEPLIEEDDGTYTFETDYLPLKGNPDYIKLMKTLVLLNFQRIKNAQDIEKLEELKALAIENPLKAKDEIFKGHDYFNRCNIPPVPTIDWSKYNIIDFNECIPNVITRRTFKKEPVEEVKREEGKEENSKGVRVRGREYNEKKPVTFNQLWTVEEQLRLEALLIEFPPEPVEFRRWRKIADALGTRTPRQVCCRVQKYFRKLQKAGISIPGGQLAMKPSSKAGHVHKRHKHFLYKPTTFFPGTSLTEDDEDGGMEIETPGEDMAQWVGILNEIKEDKLEPCKTQHFLYKCLVCSTSPIVGLRWECKTCASQESSVSLCSDCMFRLTELDPPPHPLTHSFKSYKTFTNPLYSASSFSGSNYLDPNYRK